MDSPIPSGAKSFAIAFFSTRRDAADPDEASTSSISRATPAAERNRDWLTSPWTVRPEAQKGLFDLAEIHPRGDVARAGRGQNVAGNGMSLERRERAGQPRGAVQRPRPGTVIEDEERDPKRFFLRMKERETESQAEPRAAGPGGARRRGRAGAPGERPSPHTHRLSIRRNLRCLRSFLSLRSPGSLPSAEPGRRRSAPPAFRHRRKAP